MVINSSFQSLIYIVICFSYRTMATIDQNSQLDGADFCNGATELSLEQAEELMSHPVTCPLRQELNGVDSEVKVNAEKLQFKEESDLDAGEHLENDEGSDKTEEKEDSEGIVERNEDFCCQLCEKDFVNPKVLTCLHVFCEECLSKRVQPVTTDDNSGKQAVACSVCNQATSSSSRLTQLTRRV